MQTKNHAKSVTYWKAVGDASTRQGYVCSRLSTGPTIHHFLSRLDADLCGLFWEFCGSMFLKSRVTKQSLNVECMQGGTFCLLQGLTVLYWLLQLQDLT